MHTIAQFSRILRFSNIYYQIFRRVPFGDGSDVPLNSKCITSTIGSEGVLYEIFGNKCSKILKFGRTELSYAQNKNGGEEMRLLGMDTYPSLNDITEIRCNKCTRSEQGYDF